jgi:hypothetical protein
MKFTLNPATVFCLTLAVSVFQTTSLRAQDQATSKPAQTKAPADATAQDEGEADEPVAPNPADLKKDPVKAKAAAWKLLETGIASPKTAAAHRRAERAGILRRRPSCRRSPCRRDER